MKRLLKKSGYISKEQTVEIEWRFLERIAEFYEFPSAVFLGNMKIFPKYKTRNESFRKKAQLYDKIKKIVED